MEKKKQERADPEVVVEEFERLSMDAGRVQRETLQKILEENGGTEYLSKWGLNGRSDPESYKACVPIVTHTDIEPYICRIAQALNGQNSSIITAKPIPYISLSSGTSEGKPKYLPFNDELVENTLQIYNTSFAFRNREYPIEEGKALQFIYGGKLFKTDGGLTGATSVTHLLRNAAFKKTLTATQRPCCSPDAVISNGDYHQSLYCHLLCALISRHDIRLVSSTFAHTTVHAFRTFENLWPHLLSDLRRGHLSSRVTSPSLRSAMADRLKPDADLADELHRKCSALISSGWYGMIPELFPGVKYVYGIMTGSMQPYIKKLRHYAGDLPLISADYGATEGWVGVNVNPSSPPEEATFAVLPNIGYFEFIPLDSGGRRAVGLTEVEIGKEYEVVLTSFAGLYRYKVGDVVEVAGFHNSTPELRFVRRRNVVLSVNLDKNTEKDLQLSVEAAAKIAAAAEAEVVDYTSCVDSSTEPAHYVVFWEMSGGGGGGASDGVMEECCNCLDRSFVDAGYVSMRKSGGIGALELRILKSGTFQKIMDHVAGSGGAVSQFKTPRCVGPTNAGVVKILSGNVAKTYFSSAY